MGVTPSTLHEAVTNGNTKKVSKLLKKHPGSVDDKLDDKTALLTTVTGGQLAMMELLLRHGAAPGVLCSIERGEGFLFEWSALHEACRLGSGPALARLLAAGGDPDLLAHHQMAPLHVAAWHGHREALQMLVDAGCDVNRLDRFRESALVIPICHGDTEVVQTLLLAGCRLNSRAWGNLRKILVQRRRGHELLCRLYARAGPFSLLSLAIKHGWLNLAVLLLQHGYNPNKCEIYAIVKIIRDSLGEIDDDGKRLIACYLAAGYHCQAGDKQLLDQLLFPPNHGFEIESLEWTKSLMDVPSLQQVVRAAVRAHLQAVAGGASIMRQLYRLELLPTRLLDYLALSEFSTDTQEMYKPINSMIYRSVSTRL